MNVFFDRVSDYPRHRNFFLYCDAFEFGVEEGRERNRRPGSFLNWGWRFTYASHSWFK